MTSRKRAAPPEPRFVRIDHWNGLVGGELVKVRGERGARFVFRFHVTNPSNGSSWIEVDELSLPRRGSAPPVASDDEAPSRPIRRQRAFAPDRIVKTPRRRQRRSRPETPALQGQLPFDLLEA